ncbi:MAG: hypothetical protein MJE66_14120 [Proteobacteria bacterium]|nr:hypothetical protein [Pseudomonadota bacterium]
MIEFLALSSVVTMFIVWSVVGVKLMLLARRSRGFPEFALGLAFTLLGGLGYPLVIATPYLNGAAGALAGLLSIVCLSSGQFLLCCFTARVFRPGVLWARGIVALVGVALVVQAVGLLHSGMRGMENEGGFAAASPWIALALAIAFVNYGWTAIESLRYYDKTRRQAALGLADPVTCNRFLLWGLVGSGSALAITLDGIFLAIGHPALIQFWTPLVDSLAGIANGVFLYLAFLAPRFYTQAIRRRFTAAHGEG